MAGLSAGFADLSKSDQFDYLTELKQTVIDDFNVVGAAFRAGKIDGETFAAAKAKMIARTKRIHAAEMLIRPTTKTEDEVQALVSAKQQALASARFKPSAIEAD